MLHGPYRRKGGMGHQCTVAATSWPTFDPPQPTPSPPHPTPTPAPKNGTRMQAGGGVENFIGGPICLPK